MNLHHAIEYNTMHINIYMNMYDDPCAARYSTIM